MEPTRPEGVTKFHVDHAARSLEPWIYGEISRTLSAWRQVLARLRLLGQDPERYGGYGFGNMSARIGPIGGAGRGRRRFIVTGTQTGAHSTLDLGDYCVVERYDIVTNQVASFGMTPPSSESLTHGAVYDVAPDVRVVMHVHAPEIWSRATTLALPATRPDVENGTPEMASEMQRVYRQTAASGIGVIVMAGHEDGVIAFGRDADQAGCALVRAFARACTLDA